MDTSTQLRTVVYVYPAERTRPRLPVLRAFIAFVLGYIFIASMQGDLLAATILPGGDSEAVEIQDKSAATVHMTEDKSKPLSSFGIDPNSFAITEEMIACAEAKLGAPRIEEMRNGATTSLRESLALAACYQ